MSAYILGSEIAADLGLLDFEFAQESVAKGLQPHNRQGQPYMPAAVVNQFIQCLEQELAQHEDTASNLSWGDRDEIIANHVGPLNKRIHGYRLYLESLNGTGWNGFEFPQDQELSRHFIQVLLNSFYRREEVYKHLAPQPVVAHNQEPIQPEQITAQVEKPAKPRKLTREQRDRLACRAVAKRLLLENPNMRSHEMILNNEITNACERKDYVEETIRRWVNDLCSNRRPGVPKKKKKLS